MKQFNFSLQKLLGYKEQVLEVERGVLSNMNARMSGLQLELEQLKNNARKSADDFNRQAAEGLTAIEMTRYKSYLNLLNEAISEKNWEIMLQKQAIERQTDKVREAKIEISSMEKLREKKLEEYHHQETKAEELFIEEFVSNKRATAIVE